ncbi:acetaldehyde dehydrogenase (acetylating) [Terriglobus sp. 2YAB30_2]|uniref:acetaldehyde dehydrogenase (acetylating) n=2 Tax=unclassified Terriglobus TaxID=2628988 RepID=UPI003F9E01B7
MSSREKVRVAILGSGNIGTDLLIKILRSPNLTCSLFIGRNIGSAGMRKANELGVKISDQGIKAIEDDPDCCDIVVDATSALAHLQHWPILKSLGKFVIDMTPSKIGEMCIPSINLDSISATPNFNMITCGGQASIPIVYAISQVQKEIAYVEVVSHIASRSAGPATRINLDEYIDTTEAAIKSFSGVKAAKAILTLNPAVPCVDMQTSILVQVASPNLEIISQSIAAMVTKVQEYVPGYRLLVGPLIEDGRVVVTVKVNGLGDYLPAYAGNLDIINCAAIATAEHYAKART